jgi:hypothetical protein
MGTQTPWGTADSSKSITRGIVLYSTPGHGGFHVSPTLNAKVHEAWRRAKGWYEEDCEWAIVVLTFPQHFTADQTTDAKSTAKNYYPHAYKTVMGEDVKPEESHVLREETDAAKHGEAWVVTCAFGDWHAKVPTGMVGVCAMRGTDAYARNRGHGGRLFAQRFFFVPAEEYDDASKRCSLGFIVDTERHQEVEAFS